MKNRGAGVSAVPTHGRKKKEKGKEEAEEEEEEEEDEDEYEEDDKEVQNDMTFYLKEDPSYTISATGVWCENTAGEVVGDADTYFRHILSGRRCENVRDCFQGWTEQNEEADKKWETLCQHIEELDGLEEIICTEDSFGV